MNGGVGAGLFAPVGLERVSPGMVIDVASLILGGFHAVPGGIHNVYLCNKVLLTTLCLQ